MHLEDTPPPKNKPTTQTNTAVYPPYICLFFFHDDMTQGFEAKPSANIEETPIKNYVQIVRLAGKQGLNERQREANSGRGKSLRRPRRGD